MKLGRPIKKYSDKIIMISKIGKDNCTTMKWYVLPLQMTIEIICN